MTNTQTNHYVRVLALIAVLPVAVGLLLMQAQKPARAGGSFIVNTTSEGSDLRPGDGVCVGDVSGSHVCTLMAGIEEANKLPGVDSTTFSISSSDGFAAIKPVSPLSVIRACYELGQKPHRNPHFTVGLISSRSPFSAFLSHFQSSS